MDLALQPGPKGTSRNFKAKIKVVYNISEKYKYSKSILKKKG